MRRASLVLLLAAAVAHADDEPHPVAPELAAHLPAPELLAAQLAGQQASIANARDIVHKKLADADALRVHRVRAAYRVLHAQLSPDATGEERMANARRRAAARLLLARDASERGILADELGHLDADATRAKADAAALPAVQLPVAIARPVHGKIARSFGTLEHERSKATLSRHGVDLEVEDHAVVTAPADGAITYVGPIRGLDRGVIVDCGNYIAVLAKLGDQGLPVVGAEVHAGDRIGRAARHRVYLEVRAKIGPGGMPIDPEPLLAKSK